MTSRDDERTISAYLLEHNPGSLFSLFPILGFDLGFLSCNRANLRRNGKGSQQKLVSDAGNGLAYLMSLSACFTRYN
jgi:hypothetical protein